MSREKLKVAVLYDVWEEEPEPAPPPPEKPSKTRGKPRRKKKKEKHDREEIFDALAKLGHEAVLPGPRRAAPVAHRAGARPTPTSSSTSPSPTPATTRRT